jgi:hypothetical protein
MGAAVQIGLRNERLSVWRWGGGVLVSTPAPAAGAWHHLAYTWDGTTHRLYVNGAQAATATTAPQAAAVTAAYMGLYDPAVMGPERYRGALDDVRIYDRPLTPAEVGALAERP